MRTALAALLVLLGACSSTLDTAPRQTPTPPPDEARVLCAPAVQIARGLAKQYGEHVVAQGRQADGSVLRIYATENRRTWTAVVTRRGVACLTAAGVNWETTPQGDPA